MMGGSSRTLGATLLLFLGLFYLNEAWAQEDLITPSQRTKEAIQKFSRTPKLVGKTLETLKDAGKAKLEGTFGAEPVSKAEAEEVPLPEKKPGETDRPRYSPAGKRDPFRPFSLRTKAAPRFRENLSPLERYELGQLKLVGIIWDIKEPRAMIEDTAGLGYIIQVGTAIGANEGKVKTIRPNEVVVEEVYSDFHGAGQKREVSLRLLAD